MVRFTFILALLFTAPWEETETVEVEDHGAVELKSFNCQDVTRSSVINRVCYDAETHRMLVQRYVSYRQYCGLPQDKVDMFLNAPSMGRFFKTEIEGGDEGGPYECPPRRQRHTRFR
jgi:hypothetical protein